LALIRDKGLQKQFYAEHDIPTSDFALVEDGRAEALSRGLPVVQKLRTGGYDGRGVQVIRTEDEARYAFDAPSVLEDAVDIEKELSVIVARSTQGEVKTYPVVESVFNALNLVDYLVAPARISAEVEAEARRVALSVVEAMDFVGLLAVELFLDKSGRIMVNEVAPRAHNSGHHTIEACGTSQFGQHLRAILGLPLGDTSQRSAAAMLNLIGGEGANGVPLYTGLSAALAEPGLHPHIYGKAAVREGRKMGHVTVLADTSDAAEQRVLTLRDHISTVHAH
jgi:5-(carboxyamino)imidazole ribonucleotide synthase